MKFLFVVDDFSGGAGNIVQLLATEYAKREEVTILLLNVHSEPRYSCENVFFKCVYENEKPSGSLKVFRFLLRCIKNVISETTPDVVLSFVTNNNILTGLALLDTKIPLVVCERNSPKMIEKLKFPWEQLLPISYGRADAVSVQFEIFSTLRKGRYKKKCVVTPNYIMSPPQMKEISSSLDSHTIKFVSFGRLVENKQFDEMISIFKEIHSKYGTSELHIYGQGPLKNQLEQIIQSSGMSNSIFLEGQIDNIYEVLCNSDIYLMTSKHEGFPNALSEAMAVGVPSVSYCCHEGIRELTDYGKRGLIADLGNRKQFVESVISLIKDNDLYRKISMSSREVSKIYDMIHVKATWDLCINKAMSRRK